MKILQVLRLVVCQSVWAAPLLRWCGSAACFLLMRAALLMALLHISIHSPSPQQPALRLLSTYLDVTSRVHACYSLSQTWAASRSTAPCCTLHTCATAHSGSMPVACLSPRYPGQTRLPLLSPLDGLSGAAVRQSSYRSSSDLIGTQRTCNRLPTARTIYSCCTTVLWHHRQQPQQLVVVLVESENHGLGGRRSGRQCHARRMAGRLRREFVVNSGRQNTRVVSTQSSSHVLVSH